MTVVATGRAKNSQNPDRYRAFHGKTCRVPIDNEAQWLEFEEQFDLWYIQYEHEGIHYLGAGTVFDIDIEGPRKHLVRNATVARNVEALCMLLEPEILVVRETLAGSPFKIYASGSKGLHIYVLDPKGFLCSDKPEDFTTGVVKAYFESRFPEEFVSLLDQSFYSNNKGIRPYTCAHPVTGIQPIELYVSPEWPLGEEYLAWVSRTLENGECLPAPATEHVGILPASPLVAARRVNAAPVVPRTVSGTEVNAFLEPEQSIDQWIQLHSGGHKRRCISAQKYVYYSDGESVNTWCPLHQGVHPSNCCSWIVYDNAIAVANCFDFACIGKIFVLRPAIEKPITYPQGVPETRISILPDTGSPYLDCALVEQRLQEEKRLVLTAPMGSGKTEAVVSYIRKMNPNARILILGTRVQQTRAWHSVFEELGFLLYQEVEGGCLRDKARLLLCLNSLLRILDSPDSDGICNFTPYDLLVLDEADSLACWLGGPLLENNSAIFECLRLLIKTSTYTICMDGIPSESLTVMLEQLGFADDFRWLVFNSFRFREVIVCNQTRYFTKCLDNALAAGKNVFFVSNSKTVITRFKDYIIHKGVPAEKVLAIHGGMSEADRQRGGNPENWVNYTVVLANTALGPGASFNPAAAPKHFSIVFGLVKVNQGASPAQIMQLLNRVRHLQDNKLVTLVLKKNRVESYAEATPQKLLQQRIGTMGFYSQRVANMLCQERLLKKRTRMQAELGKEIAKHAALGKTLPAAKRRALTFVPTIVPIPAAVDGQLVGVPRASTFALRIGGMDLERLASHVMADTMQWASDSEHFMSEFLELLHLSGAGYTIVGQRTEYNAEGVDIVLGSHYGYLNEIKNAASSSDTQHLDNDYFLLKVKDSVEPERFEALKKQLFDNTLPGLDTSLFRFQRIAKYYKGDNESIAASIEHDVDTRFADEVRTVPPMTTEQFRPLNHPRGASINNKTTLGEIMASFHNILYYMERTWNPETKSIEPLEPYSTLSFIQGTPEYRKSFWKEVQRLAGYVLRENSNFGTNKKIGVQVFMNTPEPPESPRDHKLLFAVLYRCLTWLGFPVTSKTKRPRIRGQRKTTFHEVTFKTDYINVCKALVGLDDTITLQQALDVYFKDPSQ